MQGSQTDSGVQEQIRGLVRAVVSSLQEIAGLERVLRRGMVHPGGPHYRLHGTTGPISIGEDECAVFGRLIAAFRPAHCFLIGNAFGMSSVFIAKMMELHGGESVVTLDDHSEGDGMRCFEIADRLRERMDCGLLVNKCGSSPGDIQWAAGRDAVDLIFIDGEHRHPQVTRDFQGVQELVREHTIVCWHDYWMPGIPESVAEAERIGYGCLKVNTSCEMVLGSQSRSVLDRMESLYPDSQAPRRRLRPAAFLKLCGALAVGAIQKRVGRRRSKVHTIGT